MIQGKLSDSVAPPRNYWINTNGNEIVNRFIDCLDQKDADKQLTQTKLAIPKREIYNIIISLISSHFRGCVERRRKEYCALLEKSEINEAGENT